MKRILTQWQKTQYKGKHDRIKKILIEATEGKRVEDIYNETAFSKVTIHKHLHDLQVVTEVTKIGKLFYWGDKIAALTRGLKKDAGLIDKLDDGIQEIRLIIDQMSTPVNLWRFRRENKVPFPKYFPVNIDPNTPARCDVMTKEQLTEYLEENKALFEHREKVLSELRHVFFDLTKLLMTVDSGITMAEDDLSNVEVGFRNKRPVWMMLPSTS
jgi:hypothetical protein